MENGERYEKHVNRSATLMHEVVETLSAARVCAETEEERALVDRTIELQRYLSQVLTELVEERDETDHYGPMAYIGDYTERGSWPPGE